MVRINLFVQVDSVQYNAVDEVARLSGVSKRALMEATIAYLMGAEHPDKELARQAWAKFRKEAAR